MCITRLTRWLLLIPLLTGCDHGTSTTSSDPPNKLHIVSAVYPMADIVRQVAGGRVELEWFCENGQDPRDIHLSEEQKKHARTADLILTSGFPDSWSGELLTERERAFRLLKPDSTQTGRALPDPHGALWLHPQIAREMADTLRERLTQLDAKQAAAYRESYDKLASEIEAVDKEYHTRLAPLAGRRFLALRPTWASLAARYGLEEITPIEVEAHKLTDEDVKKLKNAAQEEGIDVLIIDAALLPGVRRELQRRVGLRLIALDPLGSSAPDGRSTWIRIMRYNLDQLVEGLAQ